MNYRLFLIEPKHVYPQLVAKGTVPEWVVAEWQPNMWRRRDVVRDRTALHAERRAR